MKFLKIILIIAFSLIICFVSGASPSPIETYPDSSNSWNLVGTYSLDFIAGSGGTWPHTMTITSQKDGSFTGTGYAISTGQPWTIRGTIDGSVITYKMLYTGNSAGYTVEGTGNILPDGKLSLTWRDSAGVSGNVVTTSGAATYKQNFNTPGPSQAAGSPKSDAVLILHFDEGSGTMVHDSSGNNYDGTIHGAQWVDGINGKALEFNGKNNFVTLNKNLGLYDNWAIEFWAKSYDTAGIVYYPVGLGVGKGIGMGGNYDVIINDFWIYDGMYILHGGPSVERGKWYFVSAVKNGLSYDLYVNGILEKNGQFPDIDINDVNIGRRNDGVWYFNGIIDEIVIYPRILSASEVMTHFTAKSAGSPASQSGTPLPSQKDFSSTAVAQVETASSEGNKEVLPPIYLFGIAGVIVIGGIAAAVKVQSESKKKVQLPVSPVSPVPDDVAEREKRILQKIRQWEYEGYDLTSLKAIKDTSRQEYLIRDYEDKISGLKKVHAELNAIKNSHAHTLLAPELLALFNQINQDIRNPDRYNDVGIRFISLKKKITEMENATPVSRPGFSPVPRSKLREIVAQFGAEVIDDPKKVKGLLHDYCQAGSSTITNPFRKELTVLSSALEYNVPHDILIALRNNTFEIQKNVLKKRLTDHAITEDAAAWAVDAWAEALGVVKKT